MTVRIITISNDSNSRLRASTIAHSHTDDEPRFSLVGESMADKRGKFLVFVGVPMRNFHIETTEAG